MRSIILLLTGFAMTAFFAAAAPAAELQSPAVVTRLANGLTVLVKPDHRFPLVSLRLYVHAGSTFETPDEAGISHLLEHMVFKGTEKRPKGRVAADVEGTGGYLNAGTSFDYTEYLTDMTKEHWKTGLDVLKDMAFHAALTPEDLASEKEVVIAELKRGEDNPGQRLFRITQRAALKGSPYRDPIIGYENTVRALSAENMRAYIKRLYQPGSMLLLVCGDVEADAVLAEAEAQFGDLKNTRPITPPAPVDGLEGTGEFSAVVERGPWNKAHLSLAVPVPGLTDVRSAQFDVLAQILGGDASSRFYRSYKYEKRLVDSISVANYSFERLGMLYIRVTLDADKLEAFWTAFSKDLASLNKIKFTEAELERARLNIEDDLFRSKETLAGYASKLGYFAFFSDGEQGEANYLRSVRDTNAAALEDLTARFLRPDGLTLAALLPGDAQLKGAAPGPDATRKEADAAWFTHKMNSVWQGAVAAWKAPAPESATTGGRAGEAEVVDLGNGRTVVLTPDGTLPYTAVNLVFSGGDALLAEKDQGLAAFTASLLGKGTKKLSATAVEDFLSDRAASLSASTGRRSFSLNMDSPARFTADMFALLQETLVTPAMKEEEAARVRENQIAAIVTREDQPTGLAFRRMFPFLFSGHPYGYLTLGEKERVASFKAKDAREFWKQQTLQPWVLSVCGTFDREAILKAAGKLPVPGKAEAVPAVPQWNSAKELDLTLAGRNQGHLFLIFPTVGYGHDDEPGLDLLQNILAGQSGLLFRDLRDAQGLGYTVTAFPWKAETAGALIFYIGTDPDKITVAEEGFRKVIDSLRADLLPDVELERGKNQMTGDYYREHQTLAARGSEAAILTLLHRPLNAARTLVDRARKVDADQLRELARKYLRADGAYVVKVLP